MYVSMNWIKDFVDLDGEDLEQLIHRFTLSTAEVEGIEYKGRDISNVVVGEIIMCQDHPDSDHLHVLKVDAGDKVYDVVCGAPNARTGIKTAFVKVGGQVGDMQIRAAKLRGIESFGMCCSAKELGISDDHSGIMELDPSYANGTDIKEIFPIDDVIFEVDNKSLTNRPDLWGHYGMAREFAALTGHELKALPVMDSDYTGDAEVPVEIRNKDLVFRYSSVRIENIQANVSPMEMQIRLYYCGMRAINLLADITNYIMLELGQPMHAFNGDKMKKIVVDTPKQEKLLNADLNHDIGVSERHLDEFAQAVHRTLSDLFIKSFLEAKREENLVGRDIISLKISHHVSVYIGKGLTPHPHDALGDAAFFKQFADGLQIHAAVHGFGQRIDSLRTVHGVSVLASVLNGIHGLISHAEKFVIVGSVLRNGYSSHGCSERYPHVLAEEFHGT